MDRLIIVVDKIEDWKPYYPTDQVMTSKDYLFNLKLQTFHNLRVINLSRKLKYLSLGYYCSLLGEARGHRVMPSLKTINDLSKKNLYISDLDDLQSLTDKASQSLVKNVDGTGQLTFRIFFGQTQNSVFKKLAFQVFGYYPCPILDVNLIFKGVWRIDSIAPVNLKELCEDEEALFAKAIDEYSSRIWRLPKKQKNYIYDLAVLVDPEEKLPPSNKEALEKFALSCERNSVYCEFITKKHISKISEFDALFIRETTSISNHTYRFAKIAESEGLVVIDDPSSILKCTNKIFISNLLERLGIKSIPGRFVSNAQDETIDQLIAELKFPMVVKIPDGSFSIGISKIENREDLIRTLKLLLKKSDLILVQKFLYTKYDWRIGVLNKKGFFACKYFMSENHWQIYNHSVDKDSDDFSGNAETFKIKEVPQKVMRVALTAASSIGNGLYGVDLKEDEEGEVYVVEINDNPNIDFGVEDQVLGDELYEELVKWFVKEIKKKKEARD